MNKEMLKLPCAECGAVREYELDSFEAKGILVPFCKGGDCEDKYAIKQ